MTTFNAETIIAESEGSQYRIEVRFTHYLREPRVRFRIWGKTHPAIAGLNGNVPAHVYLTVDQMVDLILPLANVKTPQSTLLKES